MAFLIGGANSAADTTFSVANSCRFNDGDSPQMIRTLGAEDTKTFTFSVWVKRSTDAVSDQHLFGTYTDDNNRFHIYFDNGTGQLWVLNIVSSSSTLVFKTNRVFRDFSAWMNIVVADDTTQSTEGNRVKIYINGTQETSWATETYQSEYADMYINNNIVHYIGRNPGATNYYFDGYMAELVWIDGTQYAATSFGQFNEDSPTIWEPIDVSGLTFGDNGAYLDFEDSDNLGDDESGNTNDWAETNLAATDQATDSPTNNFATWNPLAYSGKTALAEGNLQGYGDDDSSRNEGGIATIGVSAGKWYWENKISAVGGGASLGIYPDASYNTIYNASTELHQGDPSIFYKSSGNKQVDDSDSSYGDSYTTNDIIGVALNLDDNEIKFYKNGTVQNSDTAVAVTSISPDFYFPVQAGVSNSSVTGNFGNPPYANSSDAADANGYGAFEYAPPSGFLALCSKNLGSDGG